VGTSICYLLIFCDWLSTKSWRIHHNLLRQQSGQLAAIVRVSLTGTNFNSTCAAKTLYWRYPRATVIVATATSKPVAVTHRKPHMDRHCFKPQQQPSGPYSTLLLSRRVPSVRMRRPTS